MEHKRWWKPDKSDDDDEAHRAALLIEETGLIEQRQAAYYELNLWNATLYTNRELIGFRWGADSDSELWPTNLRTENLIEMIGEAMLSKASSSPLKPTLIPHGNNWEMEKNVRLLDNFIFGVWRMTNAEDTAVQAFRDAFIASLGCARIAYDSRKKTVHTEAVFFDNIVIDNRECANRALPRTYRIRQVVPAASVEARFGIELDAKQGRYVEYREVGDGWVVLVEAWRLPDFKGEGGRHTIACCGKLIEDEEWTHDWVPLVFFHWQDRTSGFVTKSGVEQLVPYQIRQNELNDDIKSAQDLGCRMRMIVPASCQLDHSQWDSENGRFLMYSGDKPEAFEWKTNLMELYQERITNKAAAFSHMAVSEMTANADLPNQVRLDSSAGVREARNMEDARHLRLWTMFEAFRMDIAKTILRVLSISSGAEAFTSVYHPMRAKAPGQSIEFKAVKALTDNMYSWEMQPTPLSQMSAAARRELLRDWTSRGLVKTGSEEARRMEGNPNLDHIEELELQGQEDIYRHIHLMESGDYEAPTEMTNTTMGILMVTANYHRLKNYEDVKKDDPMLQRHIDWVTRAISIQVRASQPSPQVPFSPTQGMPGTNATTIPPSPSMQ